MCIHGSTLASTSLTAGDEHNTVNISIRAAADVDAVVLRTHSCACVVH